jgi:eukaryotic-like serine/threonine-protein kinase
MGRVVYPSGDTTASRVKGLVLWVERARGREARDGLLRGIKIDPEYLGDETRPLPIATYCQALQAFAAQFGRETLLETWPGVLHDDNLAVWTRVLRGATRPEDALSQLNVLGADERHTCIWQTLSSKPGCWRGRVSLLHDPTFEQDGLWALARAAELAAVPALFGLGAGTVEVGTLIPVSSHGGGTASAAQTYLLRWHVPNAGRVALWAMAGAALAGPVLLASPDAIGASAAAGLVLLGAAVGHTWHSRQKRAAESFGQVTRIRVLERGVALKEQRERSGVGFVEGSVVAGKYRLGRKLGTGASGVIHEAVRLADNAPVAVKLLRAAVAHDMVASDRLRRESEALGLTWHPNVVEIYEYDHLPDGTAYLVMELLRGESLAARLRRTGPLTATELGPIALQVCDALGAVHAAGVIHRDVKPSNIFLSTAQDGAGPERVKVLDFGIARVEWAETRLTNGGAPLGTPGYMSPEQETGEEIDGRSDLYGLGAVLYECFMGILPPAPASGSFSIRPGVASPLASPLEAARVPAGWLQIVRRAMAALPQERYADARTMRDAIAELVQSADTGERTAITSSTDGGPEPRKKISTP